MFESQQLHHISLPSLSLPVPSPPLSLRHSCYERLGAHFDPSPSTILHASPLLLTLSAHAGQSLIVGRYCIHLHLLKDNSKSFARANSIHDGFQRAVTVHDSHYLEIADNVAFRIMAHTFFVEGALSLLQQSASPSDLQ